MWSAEEAVSYFHSLERFGVNPGLERIGALCELLGHPESALRCIHVAGTNGKGTVCTEIACVLRAAGFRAGLYVSPYVTDFCERIQINGEMIAGEALAFAAFRVRSAVEQLNEKGIYPTEFEAVTAAAFICFAEAQCDVVVLETGLGGRFDATNIISAPIVSVITSISMDHTKVLGDTLPQIAYEKSGIIKPYCYTVTGDTQPAEVLSVIRESASKNHSFLFEASVAELFEVLSGDITGTFIRYRNREIKIPFAGVHQIQNAALAVKACEVIGVNGLDITPQNVKTGIEAAKNPARTEVLCASPLILLDGSHNDDSTKALADVLQTYLPGKRIIAVMGMMEDKDVGKAVENLKEHFSHVIAVTPSNPRAMPAKEFSELLRLHGVSAEACDEPTGGVERAIELLTGYDALVVCGSLYLAADVRAFLISKIQEFI